MIGLVGGEAGADLAEEVLGEAARVLDIASGDGDFEAAHEADLLFVGHGIEELNEFLPDPADGFLIDRHPIDHQHALAAFFHVEDMGLERVAGGLKSDIFKRLHGIARTAKADLGMMEIPRVQDQK